MNKPCPTCPFLEVNRGRPTPTDHKSVDVNESDWYSDKNINGIWEVCRKDPIKFLSCHTTDHDYYGKDGQKEFVCVGAALLIYIHIELCSKLGGFKKYKAALGKKAILEERIMGEKAFAFVFGRTSPLWGGLTVPTKFEIALDKMRWPAGQQKAIELFKSFHKKEKIVT